MTAPSSGRSPIKPRDEELRRFRDEAAALLGLGEPPAPCKEEKKPPPKK